MPKTAIRTIRAISTLRKSGFIAVTQLAQQLLQLRFRNRIGVVIDRLEIDTALLQRFVDLPARRAGWLLIDDDAHRSRESVVESR